MRARARTPSFWARPTTHRRQHERGIPRIFRAHTAFPLFRPPSDSQGDAPRAPRATVQGEGIAPAGARPRLRERPRRHPSWRPHGSSSLRGAFDPRAAPARGGGASAMAATRRRCGGARKPGGVAVDGYARRRLPALGEGLATAARAPRPGRHGGDGARLRRRPGRGDQGGALRGLELHRPARGAEDWMRPWLGRAASAETWLATEVRSRGRRGGEGRRKEGLAGRGVAGRGMRGKPFPVTLLREAVRGRRGKVAERQDGGHSEGGALLAITGGESEEAVAHAPEFRLRYPHSPVGLGPRDHIASLPQLRIALP